MARRRWYESNATRTHKLANNSQRHGEVACTTSLEILAFMDGATVVVMAPVALGANHAHRAAAMSL